MIIAENIENNYFVKYREIFEKILELHSKISKIISENFGRIREILPTFSRSIFRKIS